MRNGRLLPDGSPDDVIKGSARDPSLFADPGDNEPVEKGTRDTAPSARDDRPPDRCGAFRLVRAVAAALCGVSVRAGGGA